MMKTNFNQYLDEQLKDAEFAKRFETAGEAWDVRRMTRLCHISISPFAYSRTTATGKRGCPKLGFS